MSQFDKPDCLAAALDYLGRGLWPVPITPADHPGSSSPGKRPIGLAWGKARHTAATLEDAYARHPGANVGLKLGPEGGVIDLDVDDPERAGPALRRMFPGGIPDTWGWDSARGFHVVFAWDGRLARYGRSIIKGVLGPGGEVRGNPHYLGLEVRIGAPPEAPNQIQTVVPPSIGDDGRARRGNGLPILALPESVFADLDRYATSAPEAAPPEAPPARTPAGGDGRRHYALAALEREAGAVAMAPQGSRNEQLNRAAFALGQLVGAGALDRPEVEATLMEAARRAGLGDSESRATVRSGLDSGIVDPRDLSGVRATVPTPDQNSCKNCNNCKNPTDKSGFCNYCNSCSPPEPWEEPVLDGHQPPLPFPLGVFPPPLAELVEVAAGCLGCPVDFPAMAALGVASGAIGRSVAIRLKEGWIESAALYLAMVGDPGIAKSPAIALMSRPLWVLSSELLERHRRDMEQHRRAKGEAPAPRPVRIVVDDSTVEALGPILQDNPRGVVMVRDELTALFAGHNQYKAGGKGADRQFYLSAWSGAPVTVDRKGNLDRIPIHIPHPFLAIVGGLTPGMLGELAEAKGRDDGFNDRILVTFPAPARVRWHDHGIPAELTAAWDAAVRALHREPLVVGDDGRERPFFVGFSPAAREAYVAWFDAHCIEAEGEDFPTHLRGPWAKLRAYCARLALVLDRLGRAFTPGLDDGHDVAAASVEGAIVLVAYFKAHLRRVRSLMRGAVGEDPDARAVLRWVVKTRRATFSASDARHNFRGRFPVDGPELLDQSLRWLESRHCIRRAADPERAGPGRPPSAVYEVNPALLGPA